MQLGQNSFSANEVVNKMPMEHLNKVFKFFGEESKSKIIANRIIGFRSKKIIHTEDLVKIIDKIKKNKKTRINNSTKVFQALRILVNKEISQLIFGLINSFKILPVGGVIAVVTFHSIEDKIVKFFFKHYSENTNSSRYLPEGKQIKKVFRLINKKPIVASSKEVNLNPPSRSAKLRCAEKIQNLNNFDDFLKKFQYLIDIENLPEQL